MNKELDLPKNILVFTYDTNKIARREMETVWDGILKAIPDNIPIVNMPNSCSLESIGTDELYIIRNNIDVN